MKTRATKLFSVFQDLGWLSFILAVATVLSFMGFVYTQTALAAQSAAAYCSRAELTTNALKNACKDGLNGTDCQNYIDAGFGQEVADVCYKAAADLASGVVQKGSVSVPPSESPSPSPSNNTGGNNNGGGNGSSGGGSNNGGGSSSGGGSNGGSSGGSGSGSGSVSNEDKKNMSDYLDFLHSNNPQDKDKKISGKPDNVKGKYVNGANQYQDIIVTDSGKPNSPVILFFNGGGWHGDDLTSKHVAPEAIARGYTVMDVTYRYGSSGVYYTYEDVMRGINHVRNNAAMYNIDPNRMAIWGDSAGGSLSMRANGSGKSGAKVAVGWSAPTNAFTGLFHSFQSFAIGVDHSTCAPTDLAGFANFADLLNGGSGDVAQYGMGLSSNDFTALGIGRPEGLSTDIDPWILLTQGLIAGKNLLSAASDVEAISSQIKSSGLGGLKGSVSNLVSKKMVECIDNFKVLSPALFASPDSSPAFLAGFENDGVVGPDQLTGMRDKLRQMGIASEAMILAGNDECQQVITSIGPAGAGGCHLGYYHKFVCATLNFVDKYVQPERTPQACADG